MIHWAFSGIAVRTPAAYRCGKVGTNGPCAPATRPNHNQSVNDQPKQIRQPSLGPRRTAGTWSCLMVDLPGIEPAV
jgi:hypothetical protein